MQLGAARLRPLRQPRNLGEAVPDVISPSVATTSTDGNASSMLPSGWWATGLNLVERCALAGQPIPDPDAAVRSARRLERWRRAYEPAEDGSFERRLAAVGITSSGLLDLLAERPTQLADRAGTAPDWASFTEAALALAPPNSPAAAPAGTDAGAWDSGFAAICWPFVELGCQRLAAGLAVEGLLEGVDSAGVRSCFRDTLHRNLTMLAGRTLVLELNVLRLAGRLRGDTPQERFWHFVQHFGQRDHATALVVEYPVLARLLAQETAQAMDSWLELLGRFASDRPEIVATVLGGLDPGPLVEVRTGSGDAHQRGRSVAVLRFSNGAKIVYKPRPLSAHAHFNDAVAWLNQEIPGLDLRTLAMLDQGRYGWVEFAHHRSCADRAEVERYYRRQGALLALLHALNGSDFHYENLIASGEQPLLVDLEALLNPQLPSLAPELLTSDPAWAAFSDSVGQVGLLPNLVVDAEGAMVDMGGNGADVGRRLPYKTPTWTAAGTDEMRLVREQAEHPGSQNRPRLMDADVEACDYATDFVSGFQAAYDAIVAGRADLLAPDGLVRRFSADELRVLVRPTRVYATLLYESTHPDVMRDALDRDCILDRLWVMLASDPVRQGIIEHERRDLWAGDIPFFYTRPDTRDVWTSDGLPHAGVLAVGGLERALQKIGELGPRDRTTQSWMIDALFSTRRATIFGGRDPVAPTPSPEVSGRAAGSNASGIGPAEALDPARALAAARAVGDRIAELAYDDGARVGWLGLDYIDQTWWNVRPLGSDLYGGYPGIALFLARLAALTSEERYAELARKSLAPVPKLVDALPKSDEDPVIGCGAFTSYLGMAYTLTHVAADLADPQLREPVEPLIRAVAPSVGQDVAFDIIDGCAGGLAAMLAVYEVTRSPAALDVARACASRLMEAAEAQEHGVAWRTPLSVTRPMTGFAHGAAGIGWALLRYAAVSGQREHAETGLAALRYERSQYLPHLDNWADHRIPESDLSRTDGSVRLLHEWCHGSMGIALALADVGMTSDSHLAADLDLAVRATLASDPEPNHSLCHGQLGQLELLTVLAVDGNADLKSERDTRGARVLAEIERTGPRCGTPGNVATPGLMTGLAGIGHGLLRLAFPDRVPSVLLLQAPVIHIEQSHIEHKE